MPGTDGDAGDVLASDEQIQQWVDRFDGYRERPTRAKLLEWLGQFAPEHLDIAHRVLDSVVVVPERDILQGYRDALNSLDGWSKKGAERRGRWYFVGAGAAGESGPAMLRLFREANELGANGWQTFFVTPKELPGLALSAYDHVVFVDDFAGTGKQMTGYWPIMQELVASEATCYLLLTAATQAAKSEIERNTELKFYSKILLGPEANVFSQQCGIFNEDEKRALDRYGRRAWYDHPRGFGACGLTLVLSHKTPNNTLAILHANKSRWRSPFPRNLLEAA